MKEKETKEPNLKLLLCVFYTHRPEEKVMAWNKPKR